MCGTASVLPQWEQEAEHGGREEGPMLCQANRCYNSCPYDSEGSHSLLSWLCSRCMETIRILVYLSYNQCLWLLYKITRGP